MERKEFLSLLGLSASSLVAICMGCSKGQGESAAAPSGVDFTLDLSQPPNTSLKTPGNYIYANGIIVAQTLNGQYIAVQQSCTHQNVSLNYIASSHQFYCSGHGGTFSETGQVTSGPPPRNLAVYQTSLNGNLLRVHS